MRNAPSIPDATRKRILSIAKEQGYTPDPLLATLMNRLRQSRDGQVMEKLAYLTFWNTRDGWRKNCNENDYFTGASERALERGYEIEHFWAKEAGITNARLSRILHTRGIRGVIFAPLPRHLGHVSLDWRHFACAAVGLSVVRPSLYRVCHSCHDGMILALRKLKHHGYKRIGFVSSTHFDKHVKHGWLSGFLIFQHGLPAKRHIPPLLVPEWGFGKRTTGLFPTSPEIGLHALTYGHVWKPDPFLEWLEKYQPDAVVSNTAHPMAFAREIGLRVPEDLGFASLHRLLDTDPWAAVDQVSKSIGAAAVDLVAAQLQNNELGLPPHAKTLIIEPEWYEGSSI